MRIELEVALLFVVIQEDRHTDVDVEVYGDRDRAIERAGELAREAGGDEAQAQPLNPSMQKEGWLCYITYSCEGDSVRVVERPLK